MAKYETLGGVVTRGEAYSKLMHHLREAQDQSLVLAHLHATEDGAHEALRATGWRGIGELLGRMCVQVTNMAKAGFQ